MSSLKLSVISRKLSDDLRALRFEEPTTHVYDPLVYAWEPHAMYLERFGEGAKEVILLGMNPGPYGMAQTGVPFGEIAMVRDWMGIEAEVKAPEPSHPKRPITGFSCTRSEVSGRRLWGWAKDSFKTPQSFFSRFFVVNYCPLVFMELSGKNRTPDKLPAAERTPLEERCDLALREVVETLQPRWVVGVGAFAENRARLALEGVSVSVGRILHPSPASPAANRGWAAAATRDFQRLKIPIP
ncbi:MAG: single-stranded DNA-binding protein [Myxococcales bacterium]|nr:single-stranded DNA-binding protein [Myxococcales bacterium]